MTQLRKGSTPAKSFPADFRRIRLALARERGHPEGTRTTGYDLIAALDDEGRLDAESWKTARDHFRFVRFQPDDGNEAGHLVHRPGGSWSLRYDIRGDDDEASGYRFQNERFVLGEYVSIREEDGLHTYRVVAVGPV